MSQRCDRGSDNASSMLTEHDLKILGKTGQGGARDLTGSTGRPVQPKKGGKEMEEEKGKKSSELDPRKNQRKEKERKKTPSPQIQGK